jgi:hypothetical protein
LACAVASLIIVSNVLTVIGRATNLECLAFSLNEAYAVDT